MPTFQPKSDFNKRWHIQNGRLKYHSYTLTKSWKYKGTRNTEPTDYQ